MNPLERHRPRTLEECGQSIHATMALDHARSALAGNAPKPFLLLHGPAGCGKTTLARCIVAHLGLDLVDLNASEQRDAGVVKCAIDAALNGIAVFLDEADSIGKREQDAIARCQPRGPIILATNNPSAISPDLRAKCTEVHVPPPSRERLRAVGRAVGATARAVVMAGSYRDLIMQTGTVVGELSGDETIRAIIGGDGGAGSVSDIMRCEAWIVDNTDGVKEALAFDLWRSRYRRVGNIMTPQLRRAAAVGIKDPKIPWSVILKGRLKREREAVEKAVKQAEKEERAPPPRPAPKLPDGGADEWV